jgi:hypothetical protein
MSNSTTNLDLIQASQAQKEVSANALLDAASPAMLYGRRASTTTGLTWGYFGGTVSIAGTPTQVINGTVTLTASATNYVEAKLTDGTVSVNQVGFTSGRKPLYSVVTGTSTVSSYTDCRVMGGASAGAVVSVNAIAPDGTGNVTLAASDVGALATSARGAAGGVASLDSGGKLPTSQLPDLAIIDYLGSVANQTAMLALAGQKGDWCARSDNSKVYVITGTDPTLIGSWTALSYPTGTGGTVTSVDLAVPGVLYTVSGGPVTNSGTLTFTLKPQAKNTFLAGPTTGADAAPTMRALVAADMSALLAAVNVFTKNQCVAPVALTDGATISVDASLSNNFTVTLGGNRTLSNPSNLTAGMVLNFAITQDGTGARTLAYGTVFKFAGGAAPTLSTTAGAKDLMSCYYDGAALMCQMNKAFA